MGQLGQFGGILREAGPGRWSSSIAAGLRWFAAAGNWRRRVRNRLPRAGRREYRAPERGQGIRFAEFGIVPPMLKLEHLHEEFDIDDSARPAFQIPGRGCVFQAAAHVADFLGVFPPPAAAKGRLGHRGRWPARRRAANRKPPAPCTTPAAPKAGPRPPENIAQIP